MAFLPGKKEYLQFFFQNKAFLENEIDTLFVSVSLMTSPNPKAIFLKFRHVTIVNNAFSTVSIVVNYKILTIIKPWNLETNNEVII